jgi:hypothetical protein
MARRTTERRNAPRREYRAPIFFRPSALHEANALDISDEGLTFVTDRPLEPGTALELFLVNKNVQLVGTVRDCLPIADGQVRVGVDFDKLEPELVEVLTLAWERRNE